ncbi:hypothetical protein Q4E40_02575 [Pontibacter sp. BT731]|uniref:hypothetical protein n=1 Tax=Pontibacter coccineus TaxID=3063328 RepID=UPI0026E1FD17|nr:hypothetical protein [Pontibacter sp. BT731]MDO6388997.1 hypothetical protein [Pontibacter sp. BT731]
MADKKVSFGLTSIQSGPIEADGGMSTSLSEEFGYTVLGTAVLETTEPSTEDIGIEESDAPIMQLVSEPGKWTIAFHTYNVSPEAMVAAFGGTITGVAPNQVWTAPTSRPSIERSVKVTTKSGMTIDMARVSLSAKATMNFDKNQLGKLEMTGTVLEPTKAGTKALVINYGTAA